MQAALHKVSSLPITTICPTHSLVWREHLKEVISIYNRLSSWTPEKGTVIVYATMYGNTQDMAEYLANKIAETTAAPVKIHRASYDAMADILADIVRYENIVIGSPTYSMELFPTIEALMRALVVRDVKNKRFCFFSSHAWSPDMAMKRYRHYAELLKTPILASADMRQHRIDDCRSALDEIVKVLA